MRIAIIGATGSIGRAFLKKCSMENVESYVLIRANSSRKQELPNDSNIHIIECGMEQMKDFNVSAIPKIDVFFFLAWANAFGQEARNNMETQIKNIQFTIDATHLAHRMGAKTFIGTGSQAEYGRIEGVLTESTPCHPENGYGMAKLCAGQMSRVECEKLGITHIWTRILSVYGPHEGEGTMVSTAIRNFLNGVSPDFTKGEQLWDYLYSDDAANALYLMAQSGIHGSTYVLGSGTVKPLREYIEIIRDVINPSIKVDFGAIPYSEGQVMHLEADISALSEDTGFEASIGFEVGIKETIKRFKLKTNKVKKD